MTDLIVHRGPDEDGHLVNDHVALGMRRLSIIDVQGGSQPVFNEDGTIAVVHNGEIYNFHELRASLEARGHQFRSRCDTEVIVHLYEEYGPKFLEHLNGMYAIALWDARQQQLLLSRDRLGVKPLFYSVTNGQLVFGSEIKCLLEHSDVPQELDHQAIYDYFTLGYIPQPRSIYTSIRKLPPASYLIAKHDQIEIHQYWQLPANVDQQISRPEAKERLRELLFDAVKRRMISDVPLGAFLSGGIDSSIVVALMAQQSSRPVKTFFIDFDEKQYSERPYAQAVADRYATEHYELTVRPNALDVLDKLVWHFDEPFADASAIPTWCISQLTRNYVTVALAGDGGDEAFGGYSRYLRILRRPEFAIARRFAGPLGQAAHRLLPRTARGVRFLESLGLSNAAFYSAGTQENETRRLLAPDLLAKVDATIIEEVHGLAEDLRGLADPLAAYTRHDIRWYLPDDILTKVDRMSMAHALEVRGPFLDYRLMEFACQMPQHWKISGTNTKSILKEAFSADLPAAVLATRKRGFSPPLGQWLRGQLRPLIDELHASPAVQSGFLNTAEVRGMVREHQSGVRDRSLQLWRILVFATWWKLHQNRNAPSDGRAAAALAL